MFLIRTHDTNIFLQKETLLVKCSEMSKSKTANEGSKNQNSLKNSIKDIELNVSTILLTKITATQNEDALGYHRGAGCVFWQLFLQRL